MKIVIVCDVLGEENNGTTIAAMNLKRSLEARGHQVRMLCPDADRAGQPGYDIVPTRDLGPFNGYVRKNGVVLAQPKDRIIKAAIEGADVVHVMMPFGLGRRAAHLAKQAGIPVSAGFHAMAENITVHFFLKNAGLANRLAYRYFAGLYRQCDAIHYPTQFLRDLYEGLYGPTNGYVISNGVHPDIHPVTAQKPAVFAGRTVILFTGRYSGEKSHRVLIQAVERSAYREQIQLIFAGEGPLKEQLQREAAVLPLPPVFSFFTRAEMVQILNYADLYVHPAEIEAEGVACLEAIACGLVPVISNSPRCATQAYAMDERNLFQYDSPANLAGKIDWWISHPEARAERSRAYLAYAHEQFDQEVCMDKMERMLRETAAKRNSGAAHS